MARITHGEVLVSEAEINAGIKRLAGELYDKYQDSDPLYIGMLTGAFIFTTLLTMEMVKIEPLLNPEVDFIRIASYGKGTESEQPRIMGDLSDSTVVEGRDVVLLDDIRDTGKTLRLGVQHMRGLGARSVGLAVLSARQSEASDIAVPTIDGTSEEIIVPHVAVTIPSDEFVLGMGLNGPNGGRVMPHIVAIHQG